MLRISKYAAAEVFIDFAEELKPIRCVRFTKPVVRHAHIRDQNPSLGMICQDILFSVTPMLQNLRFGLRKRRNGKIDVPVKQRGGTNILKLMEKHKTASFSLSANRCSFTPLTLKPEERVCCCRFRSVDVHDQQKGLEFC